jgi:hypothetical protein
VVGTVYMSRYVLELPPTNADEASALFRALVPEAEWDSGLMIVTESGGVDPYRFLFHIPAAYRLIMDPSSSAVSSDVVAGDWSWVMVTSGRPVQFAYAQAFTSGRYHLYLRQPLGEVDQGVSSRPTTQVTQASPASEAANACAVDHMVGFNQQESWGVWSAQDPAEIALAEPVSGNIRLRLVAYGLAKNPSRTLQIAIGDSIKSITLPVAPKQFELDYNLHSASKNIAFRGIVPRSPKSLGVSEDNRPLGVALIKLECSRAKPSKL